MNQSIPWLIGTKHSQNLNHFPESKTRPRILKCSKVFLDSGTCFGFWGSVFGFWDVFWILGSVFGFWEVFCP